MNLIIFTRLKNLLFSPTPSPTSISISRLEIMAVMEGPSLVCLNNRYAQIQGQHKKNSQINLPYTAVM